MVKIEKFWMLIYQKGLFCIDTQKEVIFTSG